MDSSVPCASQQDSNSVALDVQDLVLKLQQAFATRRHTRRNAPRGPRGISCRRQKRQHARRLKPSRRNDTHTPPNTNTELTLPANNGGDAAQPHHDAPRFFDIEEILAQISYVEVDEINLTQCYGSEGIQKAIDSAVPVYMTLHEMRDEQGIGGERRRDK
ncbi:hypothetical protein CEP52_014764 [Fusarium oligoseptatum]|uniref:Uncharacterized protein n=1 Tax=Fusarium oligoseptatum TaxID=2604345 RepID=A0A428SJD7_9HYPO|nr:hypothetical protein CEP52_014764 [Fusarium oligoseptatum]